MKTLIYFAFASLLIACSGNSDRDVNDGFSINPDLEARCQGHCDITNLDVDACTPGDREACLDGCRAAMAGINSKCGVCRVDAGEAIHGSGDMDGTYCDGGSVASIAIDDCASFCTDTGHPGGDLELTAHCAAHCDISNLGVDACTNDDREACRDRCALGTSGLEFTCAVCLIDEGEAIYGTGYMNETYCDGGSLADLSDTNCAQFCQ